jgi:hypothetical protein
MSSNLLSNAIDKVTVKDWEKCVRHVGMLQGEAFVKECNRDSINRP